MAARIIDFPSSDANEQEQLEGLGDGVIVDVLAKLRDTEIWREMLLPLDCKLDAAADALITLFGWGGYHIWQFESAQGVIFDDPNVPADDFPTPEDEQHVPAMAATLEDVLPEENSTATFVYDFGDYWEIELTRVTDLPADMYIYPIMPLCVDGQMMAPLEDVGGVGGWEGFLEVMKDPQNSDYEMFREWAGIKEDDVFMPEYFLPRDVNAVFAEQMLDGMQEELPDDVDTLKDMVVELFSDNLALQTETMLMAADMFSSLQDIDGFDFDDLPGF